jgi:hypothetical protein
VWPSRPTAPPRFRGNARVAQLAGDAASGLLFKLFAERRAFECRRVSLFTGSREGWAPAVIRPSVGKASSLAYRLGHVAPKEAPGSRENRQIDFQPLVGGTGLWQPSAGFLGSFRLISSRGARRNPGWPRRFYAFPRKPLPL